MGILRDAYNLATETTIFENSGKYMIGAFLAASLTTGTALNYYSDIKINDIKVITSENGWTPSLKEPSWARLQLKNFVIDAINNSQKVITVHPSLENDVADELYRQKRRYVVDLLMVSTIAGQVAYLGSFIIMLPLEKFPGLRTPLFIPKAMWRRHKENLAEPNSPEA